MYVDFQIKEVLLYQFSALPNLDVSIRPCSFTEKNFKFQKNNFSILSMSKLKEKMQNFKYICNIFRTRSNIEEHPGEPKPLERYFIVFKKGTNEEKHIAHIKKYILLDESYGKITGFRKNGIYDEYFGRINEIAVSKIKKLRCVLDVTQHKFTIA